MARSGVAHRRDHMILTIHRGSKQIGGSCVELRSARGDRILLDVGMPLTQADGSDWPRGTMTRPGEELRREGVLPDIDGLHAGSSPDVSALVLSHAHPEDLADLACRLHARAVVPIHTEAAPQFADFIQNVRVVNDGEAVEVTSLIAVE